MPGGQYEIYDGSKYNFHIQEGLINLEITETTCLVLHYKTETHRAEFQKQIAWVLASIFIFLTLLLIIIIDHKSNILSAAVYNFG